MGNDSTMMRRLAVEALQVQDACNLSGVLHGFARAMGDLLRACNGRMAVRDAHPITRLWVDKIASLTGYAQDYGPDTRSAYGIVREIAGVTP